MTLLLLASACLLIVTLCYASLCAAQPFADCRRCGGMGHATKVTRRGTVKRGKPCRHCKTTGKRIRRGRHLYNLWHHTYDRGTR
ncbi:hypothetical protein OG702_22760 [Streptomyces sp. NBC_01198]|nr:hypothetical protein OG702_22760 [Streptomyces sp. NBC_01198]